MVLSQRHKNHSSKVVNLTIILWEDTLLKRQRHLRIDRVGAAINSHNSSHVVEGRLQVDTKRKKTKLKLCGHLNRPLTTNSQMDTGKEIQTKTMTEVTSSVMLTAIISNSKTNNQILCDLKNRIKDNPSSNLVVDSSAVLINMEDYSSTDLLIKMILLTRN